MYCTAYNIDDSSTTITNRYYYVFILYRTAHKGIKFSETDYWSLSFANPK